MKASIMSKQITSLKNYIFTIIATTLIFGSVSKAEEGMWTFDNPPLKLLQDKYGFTPTKEWLDHVRLSSVRFMDGGSGSFVSPNGLVLTNHHVAMGQLQKMSTAENDYIANGFYAETYDKEVKCPDLEINVLISMEDVTAKVQGAVKKNMSDEEALQARRAISASIEKESMDKTGLKSDVISLYQGGEYWLYCYKKYTDIRIVMAPEQQAAFFGGDYDNFTYPRYDIDFALLRVYENDKPLVVKDYLKWNVKGADDGELVFVSGHPGSTSRLDTYTELVLQKDFYFPLMLQYIDDMLKQYYAYSEVGKEQARRAHGAIYGMENSRKAMTGEYQGLQNPKLMNIKKKQEEDFKSKMNATPELKKKYDPAWKTIYEITNLQKERMKENFFGSLKGSKMEGYAGNIVRYVVEVKKPDGERLPGYHDAELEVRLFNLESKAPIYKDMEEFIMTGMLKNSLEMLGPDNKFIKTVLNGKSPEEVVKNLIQNTKMNDPEFRKKLIEGGEEAVRKSDDPLIVLAWKLDPIIRERIEWNKKHIESILTPAKEKIAKARFDVYGKTIYPDANFTLRLSYGTVKGYPMNGTIAPPKTTLFGLFDRSESFNRKSPFNISDRYWQNKDKLDLSTPVDLVTTNDIIGGNSGSPLINKDAEFVGLIFDGNIESLPGSFIYDMEANRTVCVHPAVIIEVLRKVYGAPKLADEILGK
jgi:hypothetical protein